MNNNNAEFVVFFVTVAGRKSYLQPSGCAFAANLQSAKKFKSEDEADTALAHALAWASHKIHYEVEAI